MASETEIHRMIVRLIGDGASYQQMMQMAASSSKEAAASVEHATDKVQKATTVINEVGGRLRMAGFRLQRTGTILSLAVTTPLSLLGRQADQATVEFESALSRMEGLVGIASAEVQGFKRDILSLGSIGKTPIELAKAMEFITGSGIRGANALETVTITAKAAAAGLGETVDVANAVTSAMNAYGPEVLSATKATDILVATVREGKAEAASFAPVFGQVLPLAKEMGITFGEVGGILAFLTRTTGNAAIATTQLRSLMSQLNSSEMDKKLKKVGISSDQLTKSIRQNGLLKALIDLKKRGDASGVPLKNLIKDIEGLMGALQLTGGQSQIAVDMIETVSNAAGDTQKAFDAASKTVRHQWNVAMAEMQIEMIKLGELLQPITTQFISFTQYGLALWKGLSKETQRFIVITLAAAAAIGPLLIGLGTVITFFGFLATSITSLTTVFATYGGTILMVTKLLGGVTVAVGSLAFSIVSAFGGVSGFFDAASNGASQLLSFLQPVGQQLANMLIPVWNAIVVAATAAYEYIKAGAATVGGYLISYFVTAVVALRDAFVDSLIFVEYFFRNLQAYTELGILHIALFIVKSAGQLQYLFGEVAPTLLDWFARNWYDVLTDIATMTATIFTNITKNIVAIFSNLPGLIAGTTTFAELWTPITDGFKSAIKELPKIADREKSDWEKALEDTVNETSQTLSQGFDKFYQQRHGELFPPDAVKGPVEDAVNALDKTAGAAGQDAGTEFGNNMKKGIQATKPLEGVASGSAQAMADIRQYMALQSQMTPKEATPKVSKQQKASTKAFKRSEREQAEWELFGKAPTNAGQQQYAYDNAMYDLFGVQSPVTAAATTADKAIATQGAGAGGMASSIGKGLTSFNPGESVAAMAASENPRGVGAGGADNKNLAIIAERMKKLVEIEEAKKASSTVEISVTSLTD